MRWLLFLVCGALGAQDLRSVTEPKLPSTFCTTLEARFSVDQDAQLDTVRIQDALDRCAAGQAVQLVRHGENRIFPIAPIRLKAGVTLVVDAGAVVLASRNPRDYDMTPGSCGVVNQQGRGCRPLILA